MLSHELRTPLATIEASARLLRDVPSLDEPARAVRHGKIERAVGRLRELFDRMLASERIRTDWQPTNVSQVDLVALAGQVRDSFAGDGLAGRVRVVPPSTEGGVSVTADGSLVRVALENLVANALTYGPVGGEILIEINKVEDGWRIGVIDGGPPIPETESAALFAPYVRGSRAAAGPGAGLGLFTVRRIARVHGGEAGLDHPHGEGNRFWIALPAAIA